MEWLTQSVQVWQVIVAVIFVFSSVLVICNAWVDSIGERVTRAQNEQYRIERYVSERISSNRDDIARATYAIGKLEMQVRELQTPGWKRWLRKIAA